MLCYCYEITASPNHTQAFADRPAENDWFAILSRGDRPDKVIQALVKELPSPRWSKEYQMVYIENKKENLGAIFRKFRGVAWVNCQYFFPNRPVNQGHHELDINHFRKRELPEGYRVCPEAYLQKLELRKYAYNTARTYISLFEGYLNYYADCKLIDVDIDSQRMLIKAAAAAVVSGKGGKDRYTLLGKTVLHSLREYYREYRPKEYLFEGEQGGRYSATSMLKIVKEAAQRAGIHKRVYPHILRHSFATAPAARTDLRHIQSLMGHRPSKTTARRPPRYIPM